MKIFHSPKKRWKASAVIARSVCIFLSILLFLRRMAGAVGHAMKKGSEKLMRLVSKNTSKIVTSDKLKKGQTGFIVGPAFGAFETNDYRGCVVMAAGNHNKLVVLSSGNEALIGDLLQKTHLVFPSQYEMHEIDETETAQLTNGTGC